MATHTLRGRRDARGHAVHPVARATVSLPPRDGDATVLRLTLRSDGAILRQVYIGDVSYRGWTAPTIWTQVTYGFPCHGAEQDMAELLARYAERRYAGAIATPEGLGR